VASRNVEVVRGIYDAWEPGDYSSADWADPSIEYVFADGPDPGTVTGLAEMAEAVRVWLSAWEDLSFTAEEYRELDDERVLVLHRIGGRGKASAVEIGQMGGKGAHVFHLRGGKVTKVVQYVGRDRVGDL
jgi:ketosteroid isomerase-like protein